jgi:hypothetical protein
VPPHKPARVAVPNSSRIIPRADYLLNFFLGRGAAQPPLRACRAPSFGALPAGGYFITLFLGRGAAHPRPPREDGAVPLRSGLCPRADHLLLFSCWGCRPHIQTRELGRGQGCAH